MAQKRKVNKSTWIHCEAANLFCSMFFTCSSPHMWMSSGMRFVRLCLQFNSSILKNAWFIFQYFDNFANWIFSKITFQNHDYVRLLKLFCHFWNINGSKKVLEIILDILLLCCVTSYWRINICPYLGDMGLWKCRTRFQVAIQELRKQNACLHPFPSVFNILFFMVQEYSMVT